MKQFIFILFVVLLYNACNRSDEFEYPLESKIAVEAWIEEGDVAHVILTRSVPVNMILDSTNYSKFIIRSAMVIVSDGLIEDTLNLRVMNQYLPPFVYKGHKIIGKEGSRYNLKIIHSNQVLTAETYIPPSVAINEVKYNKINPTDTIGTLSIKFNDPQDQKNYYQISTLLNGYDEIFVPAFYGNLDDKNFSSPSINFDIIRGVTIFPRTNIQVHFKDGDYILVKLRTMTTECFDFWNSWQNEIVNTQNPIFPANTSLKSNIVGGIGIWGGYGKNEKYILAK